MCYEKTILSFPVSLFAFSVVKALQTILIKNRHLLDVDAVYQIFEWQFSIKRLLLKWKRQHGDPQDKRPEILSTPQTFKLSFSIAVRIFFF